MTSEDPKKLLSPTDPRREPRSFTLAMARPLGTKRGKLKGSFVGDTREQAVSFYRDLVQQLTAWQPKETAWRIASELGWARTYDAEYLALAEILGCRLVTVDARLRRGAARLGYVVGPTEL